MFTEKKPLVGSEGSLKANLCLVGEAPGAQEVRLNRPFVGAAGQLLDECFRNAGIVRNSCYITNVVKEQPPRNDISTFISFKKGVPIRTEAYEAYVEQLRLELERTEANCIVAVGGTALYALTGLQEISKRRGSVYESSLLPGRKVLAMMHPAAALRQYLLKYPIIFDLKRAKVQSTFPEIRRPTRALHLEPSYHEAIAFLQALAVKPYTTLDIEVLNEEVSCLSMGHASLGYMCIPFINAEGDYFSLEQETTLWREIARICAEPHITKIGQNLTFDATFLYRKLGIIMRPLEDTMIAQGILYPDLPKGLDFLTSIYTDEPYYKDEGKKWFKLGGSFRDFYGYNAKDSAVLPEIWERQQVLLHAQQNWEAYCRQRDLIEPLIAMTERGVCVDLAGMRKASAEASIEITNLKAELERAAGRPLNHESPKQLCEYFYETCGFRPYVNRKTHAPSTDKDALKRLSRKSEAAKIILKLRKLSKLKGTYLDMKLDADERLRCAFNPVGTISGRLSSSETIFGTGGNMQNLPVAFRRFLLVDPDHIGYQIDLSQAENRDVAYVAPDAKMIHAFEAGLDVHRLTASLIFDKPYDEVSDKDGSSAIGGGLYSERFWGKKANHGLNYDLGYKTFAVYYEIPEADARYIVERYHMAYPGVRRYHEAVKAQLRQNKTLVNSFGRHRLFLDRWGDALWKNGYSFHPQSTIAEKLNIDGVCFTYYILADIENVDLLNQVHDSIWFQIPTTLPLSKHAHIVHTIKSQLQTPITWKTKSFSIPADVEATVPGGNFGKFDAVKNPGGLQKVKGETEENILQALEKIAGAEWLLRNVS